MSMLVKIQKGQALIDGEIKEINDVVRVPNSIAMAWKSAGRCIDANGDEYLKDFHARKERQELARKEKIAEKRAEMEMRAKIERELEDGRRKKRK